MRGMPISVGMCQQWTKTQAAARMASTYKGCEWSLGDSIRILKMLKSRKIFKINKFVGKYLLDISPQKRIMRVPHTSIQLFSFPTDIKMNFIYLLISTR